jgi:hypothetical protein
MTQSLRIILAGLCLTGFCACQSTPSQSTPNPQASASPIPGQGAFSQNCTPFVHQLEQDLKIANPSNKSSLKASDLGVGSDSFLQMKFQTADQNKDGSLDLGELKTYLSDHNLDQICTQP